MGLEISLTGMGDCGDRSSGRNSSDRLIPTSAEYTKKVQRAGSDRSFQKCAEPWMAEPKRHMDVPQGAFFWKDLSDPARHRTRSYSSRRGKVGGLLPMACAREIMPQSTNDVCSTTAQTIA